MQRIGRPRESDFAAERRLLLARRSMPASRVRRWAEEMQVRALPARRPVVTERAPDDHAEALCLRMLHKHRYGCVYRTLGAESAHKQGVLASVWTTRPIRLASLLPAT